MELAQQFFYKFRKQRGPQNTFKKLINDGMEATDQT